MKLQHKEEEGVIWYQWFDDIKDCKPEYAPIKCNSLFQFFTLRDKTTTISKDNLVPIKDIHYTVFSPQENRHYLKEYKGYDLDELIFYRPTLTFSGQSESIEALRRYVEDGNVHILMDAEQVKMTIEVLTRAFKSHFKAEGKLDYWIFIGLLNEFIRLEDYKEYGSHLIGFKTVCMQFQQRIDELWRHAKGKNS